MPSASPRAAAAIAAAGVTTLLAFALLPPQRILSRTGAGDMEIYFRYAQRTFDGDVPYRDFYLEYPPGFLPVMLAAGPADDGYYDRFRLLMLGLAAATIVLLVIALYLAGANAGELAAGALVTATLPLMLNPGLVFERFDFWPTALVLLSVVALLRGRRPLGFAALGVGAVAKLYPLAILPLAVLAGRGRAHLRRDLVLGALLALVLVVPFAIVAPRGLGRVGWLLVRRPLHAESLGGSILLLADRLGVYDATTYFSFGNSWDLAGTAPKVVAVVGSLVEGAAIVAVWLLFARGPREPRDLLLAVAAAVVGFVAFGKVLSPQYMVWVAAAVPLALGRVRPFALGATVAAALLTLYVYGWSYFDLLAAGPTSWAMLARNVILVTLFCSLLLELAARGRTRAATPAAAAETATPP
jgi:Glycosyltransferase family 87